MLTCQVAGHDIVNSDQIQVTTKRKGDKIAIQQHNSDPGPSQFVHDLLADIVLVGSEFKRRKEHTSHGSIDQMPAGFVCILGCEICSLLCLGATGPKQAVVVSPRQGRKFSTKDIE